MRGVLPLDSVSVLDQVNYKFFTLRDLKHDIFKFEMETWK